MKKTSLAIAILLTCSSHICAEESNISNHFQHEANLTYAADVSDNGSSLWQLDYRYYFDTVDTEESPYALNTFLAQNSNVGAQYSSMNTEYNGLGGDFETDSYSFDGTYVFDSSWFLGLAYQQVSPDEESASYDQDSQTYTINAGYYINESASLSAFYNNSEQSDEIEYELIQSAMKSTINSYGIEYRHFLAITPLSGIDLSARLSQEKLDYSSQSRGTSNTTNLANNTLNTAFINLDWYINRSWSIGANYQWQDVEAEFIGTGDLEWHTRTSHSDSLYGLHTAYWWQISQHFAANFSAVKMFASDEDNNSDGFLLGASINGRF